MTRVRASNMLTTSACVAIGVERLLSLFPEYGVEMERPWSTAAGERRHWQSLIDVSEASGVNM